MVEANHRRSQYPIDPIFLERWSPRAFTGEAIPEEELLTIFEAARWSPSSYNSQPARFLYAHRDSPDWEKFLNILVPFNQAWAKNAAALIVIVSNSLMLPPGSDKPVPSRTHSFDTGCAWGYLALQAYKMNWMAHGMSGIDFDRAFAELNVPEGYRVECAVAIGRLGDKAVLPEQLQEREAPSSRNDLKSFVFEGGFPTK